MFMTFLSVLIVASVPLLGGRLALLAGLRLQRTGLMALALGAQVLMTEVVAGAPRPVLVVLHLGSYATVAVALWANRALPGLLLLGAGAALNLLVISLNGGTLPASAGALEAAGWSSGPERFANSGVLADPVLPWLGDIAATPAFLPFRNVISPGDVLILLGAAVLVHVHCRSAPARLAGRLLRRAPGSGPAPGPAALPRKAVVA